MTVVPRRLILGALVGAVVLAILMATVEAALVYRAIGPLIAAVLGAVVLPTLVRGARRGCMRSLTAWATTAVGIAVCAVATIGLDPDRADFASISWYTCGVLAGSVMVWMTGHRLPPIVSTICLVVQVVAWAGPVGALRLGLAGEIVLVVAGLIMQSTLRSVTAATAGSLEEERRLAVWQAEQDAFQLERESRLRHAGSAATPLLQRIIALDGRLDARSRAECRVLEQTLRDEIRGRRLLNDAVRRAVLAHRSRGAFVQVLDDGGLDGLTPIALELLLNDLAQRLEPVRSSRIVIRTGRADSATAVTVVASTPDETAAALGLDDDRVDLWLTLPYPTLLTVPAYQV